MLGMYHPGIYHPRTSLGIPLYAAHPATACRCTAPGGSLTALTLTLAELTIRHAVVTVAAVTNTRFTVGRQLRTVRERQPPYRPVWERGTTLRRVSARPSPVSLSGNTVHTSPDYQLCPEWGNKAGIHGGSGHAGTHPFHWPAVRK